MKKKGKRAAAYCRVSTASDLQDGSFETQCDYYYRKIEMDPELIFVGIYGDQGKSGRAIKGRTAFIKLLNDCEAGKIDIIYTKSISRFARNMTECIATIRKLQAEGVAIYFERENIDTTNRQNELLLGILATIAQEESVSISQNMKWARKKACLQGKPVEKASYGYRSVGKEHRWVICKAEANRVQLAFYMAGMCHNNREIRDALNKMEKAENTGKVWNQTPIRHLLTNLVYVGDYLSNKECSIMENGEIKWVKNRGYVDQFYIEGHHEAIVSRELFEHVGILVHRHLLFANRTQYSEDEIRFMEKCIRLTKKEFHGV
jgi:DNA invertase Pin-like site-specific DNA recombinase